MQEPSEVNYFPPSKQIIDLMDTIVFGNDFEELYVDAVVGVGDEKEVDERPPQEPPSDEEIDAMVEHQQKHV